MPRELPDTKGLVGFPDETKGKIWKNVEAMVFTWFLPRIWGFYQGYGDIWGFQLSFEPIQF